MVTDATFAVNDAVDAPEATVTAAGTVTALLLLATVTLMPFEGAAEVSDTVQVVDPEPVNELLPHEKELIEGVTAAAAPLRLIEVVFEVVPWVAISVTVCAEVTADTLAVKLALDAPDGNVIEAGTVTEPLLLERETLKPPLGAPALNVNLQVSVPAPVIEGYVQLRPVR